jgi:ATP-dependent exoDNAse (exonuclease V) beta subunit
LDVESAGGVRQQELLAESPTDDGGMKAHQEWRERRGRTLESGRRPTVPVAAMTELSARTPATNPARIERTNLDRAGRPKGRRFGTLVHALLARAPFDATPQTLKRLGAALARLVGATPDEEAAAVASVDAAFAHPIVGRAARSTDVRRETPVVHRQPDGTLAEGVIDLVFRGAEGWLVVDFKTDDSAAAEQVYAAQLGLYVDAVRTATGEPAEGVLLLV